MLPPTSTREIAAAGSAVRTHQTGPRHFAFVDALRGLAILGVLLVHVGQRTPGIGHVLGEISDKGKWGVQLFFVVSAFTLFWSLGSRSKRERRPIVSFFIRRIFRIVPLFWIAAAFYYIHTRGAPSFYAPNGLGWRQVVATLLLVHGWHPTSFNSVVPGGWSIAAEFMFYLCIPFLFRRVRSLGSALWLTAISTLLVSRAMPLAVTLIAGHFPLSWRPLISTFVPFSFPVQIPVFCMGIVLYFLFAGTEKPPSKASVAAALGALTATVLLQRVPGHILAAIAFVGLAYLLSRRPLRVVVNPVMRFLGAISFSAYIWHFWVLDLLAPFIAHWGRGPRMHFVLLYVLLLGATVPLAAASYYLIEVPGQWLGKAIIGRMALDAPARTSLMPGELPARHELDRLFWGTSQLSIIDDPNHGPGVIPGALPQRPER